MLQEVVIEHPTNEQTLRVVDHEGKLVLLLHLQSNEHQPQGHTLYLHLSVGVAPAARYRSCLLKCLLPAVDETDPHVD